MFFERSKFFSSFSWLLAAIWLAACGPSDGGAGLPGGVSAGSAGLDEAAIQGGSRARGFDSVSLSESQVRSAVEDFAMRNSASPAATTATGFLLRFDGQGRFLGEGAGFDGYAPAATAGGIEFKLVLFDRWTSSAGDLGRLTYRFHYKEGALDLAGTATFHFRFDGSAWVSDQPPYTIDPSREVLGAVTAFVMNAVTNEPIAGATVTGSDGMNNSPAGVTGPDGYASIPEVLVGSRPYKFRVEHPAFEAVDVVQGLEAGKTVEFRTELLPFRSETDFEGSLEITAKDAQGLPVEGMTFFLANSAGPLGQATSGRTNALGKADLARIPFGDYSLVGQVGRFRGEWPASVYGHRVALEIAVSNTRPLLTLDLPGTDGVFAPGTAVRVRLQVSDTDGDNVAVSAKVEVGGRLGLYDPFDREIQVFLPSEPGRETTLTVTANDGRGGRTTRTARLITREPAETIDRFTVDFSQPDIATSGIDAVVTGPGFAFNAPYKGCWRMLYPGHSFFAIHFTVPSSFRKVGIKLDHLSSASSSAPHGGYSPVDLEIVQSDNVRMMVRDNFDVGLAHEGSHGFEEDEFDLTSFVRPGHNVFLVSFEDDPWAYTHYWVRRAEINVTR